MNFRASQFDRDVSLMWRTKPGPPRTHYGARAGEHPRYAIRHERRSGALFWIVYYRPGGLQDVELVVDPKSLREAQRLAENDLACRVALREIPKLQDERETDTCERPSTS